MITPNMNTLKILAIPMLLALFASCDKTKSNIAEFTKQFVEAANENDKVKMYEMYPMCRKYSCLELAKNLNADDIDVEYIDSDSVYVAKLNDKQSLIVKTIGKDTLEISDSYGVFKLDSISYELAAKTGAPVNKQSDMANGKIFDEDGNFISGCLVLMKSLVNHAPQGNLYYEGGVYQWRRRGGNSYVAIFQPIRNAGKHDIKGEDYRILFTFTDANDTEFCKESIDGVDISSGETRTIEFHNEETFSVAQQYALHWTVTFHFKNMSKAAMLLKYGTFCGTEYDTFTTWAISKE